MLTAQDLGGIMAMMPAFATANAAELTSTQTIDLANLENGVNRLIGDGVDVIATAGSFGEFHTLLWDEHQTMTRATVEIVNKRVPLFIGCTSLNSRLVIRKMELARELGAEGVMLGVPFYFPSTAENALHFFREMAAMFPDLAIMLYHNPGLHRVTLSLDMVRQLMQIPNVVAMKETDRDAASFLRLMKLVKGRLSIYVHQRTYYPYSKLGADGVWSIDVWMGPEPLIALRDAIGRGDDQLAEQISLEIANKKPADPSWRETANKISIRYAGYCDPGPLRPPFTHIPEDVDQEARERAIFWRSLCEKYSLAPVSSQ